MTNKINNYQKLAEKFEQISHLKAISGLTHWDAAVMMPSGSAAKRHVEMATLQSLIHQMSTSKEMDDLIEAAGGDEESLNDWQKANLKLIKKSHDKVKCISSEMSREFSIASSESEFTWRQCRAENNFEKLVPYLNRVFKAATTIAGAQAETAKKSAYDVLVDSFDPDRCVAEINPVFNTLKVELPSLMHKIIERQSSEKVLELTEKIDEATQKAIGLKVLSSMGFDLNRGRLDKSTHPFCIGGRFDVRMTTRYDESNFLSSLFGVIHETGHGLYQQNLPEQYMYQAVGEPKGMAFHESQSLIMEMQAGSSKSFMQFLARLLRDEFGFKGPEYSAENLYKLMTRVKPSFIRVDADEVTYPLHVILRFEIEQEIVAGNVKAIDLPKVWNDKMKEYLGIVPDTYANGCLQDIHWPSGWLGYFPSYTNGAIIASMLMKKAKEQYGKAIDDELSKGSFSSLNNYLNKNLREHGSLRSSEDLLMISTGFSQIEPLIFIDYLKDKYL